MVKAAQALRDVRCFASGDLRTTTSLSDGTTRWLAASGVYIAVKGASDVLKRGMVGIVVDPISGIKFQAFEVIYADNGREKWMVNPAIGSSIKLLDTPYPGSLVQGNGIVQPTAICN